jgi:hypothetical protein
VQCGTGRPSLRTSGVPTYSGKPLLHILAPLLAAVLGVPQAEPLYAVLQSFALFGLPAYCDCGITPLIHRDCGITALIRHCHVSAPQLFSDGNRCHTCWVLILTKPTQQGRERQQHGDHTLGTVYRCFAAVSWTAREPPCIELVLPKK